MTELVLALILGTGGSLMASEEKSWEFGAGEIVEIQAETEAGEISMEVSDGPVVKVLPVPGVAPEKCEIGVDREGAKLFLSARSKKRWFFGGGTCKTGFLISAPASTKLILKTGSGAVAVGAFSSGAVIHSGAGQVRLAGICGKIRVNSGAGPVSGEIDSGDLRVNIGTGLVDLAWKKPPESGAAEICGGSGSVRLAFPAVSRINISNKPGGGHFESGLESDPDAPFSLNIRTWSADVRIAKRG